MCNLVLQGWLNWQSLDDIELLKKQTVLIFLRCLKAIPCMRSVRNVPLQAQKLYSQGFSIFSVSLTKMASYYWGKKWRFLLSCTSSAHILSLSKSTSISEKGWPDFELKCVVNANPEVGLCAVSAVTPEAARTVPFTWQLHTILFFFFTHFLYLICPKNRSFLQKSVDCIQPFVGVNLICAHVYFQPLLSVPLFGKGLPGSWPCVLLHKAFLKPWSGLYCWAFFNVIFWWKAFSSCNLQLLFYVYIPLTA